MLLCRSLGHGPHIKGGMEVDMSVQQQRAFASLHFETLQILVGEEKNAATECGSLQ